jgi:hypothetical protein
MMKNRVKVRIVLILKKKVDFACIPYRNRYSGIVQKNKE